MSIPTENVLNLINGFTFVSTSSNNKNIHQDIDISRGTQMAHKCISFDYDDSVKELNIMKDALRWDVEFRRQGNYTQLPSSALKERHYYHEIANQNNEGIPASRSNEVSTIWKKKCVCILFNDEHESHSVFVLP